MGLSLRGSIEGIRTDDKGAFVIVRLNRYNVNGLASLMNMANQHEIFKIVFEGIATIPENIGADFSFGDMDEDEDDGERQSDFDT